MPLVSLLLLAVSWGYAVFAYGGVLAPMWRWSVLGVAAAGLSLWLLPDHGKAGRSRNIERYALFLVLLLGILQLPPLPLNVLHWLSPNRFNQLAAASQVLGPIGAAPLSSVPAATRDMIVRLASYVLVYLIVCDLRRRLGDRYWLLAAPVILAAVLQAVLGLVQYYGGADIANGTYVDRDHFAGLLEMSLPFAMMYGFDIIGRNRDRFQSPARPVIIGCLFFGAASAMLVAVIDSQSRMGFISVLASLLVMGIVGISGHYSGTEARWRRLLPVAAVTVTIAAAFVFLPTDQLIGRFASMASTQGATEDTRRELWKETVPLIEDYRITGCGLGAYESCFLPYKNVAPENAADYAHDDYLQLMAEFGVPAFALMALLAVFIYGRALRGTALDNPGRCFAIACVGSLSAIFLHSFVDFNLYIPANGMLAVWVGAMASEA